MSFSITMVKNDEGTYDLNCTSPETLPEKIVVSGHVEADGQVVDLTARVTGLVASSSRRQYPV